MKKENLVSIKDYATICGVVPASIYARIKAGHIVPNEVKWGKTTCKCIDLSIYPAEKMKSGRKPFKA